MLFLEGKKENSLFISCLHTYYTKYTSQLIWIQGSRNSQVERYGLYTVPYYYAQDDGIVRLICGRKIAVFSSFSIRKHPVNDAVLIDLGCQIS